MWVKYLQNLVGQDVDLCSSSDGLRDYDQNAWLFYNVRRKSYFNDMLLPLLLCPRQGRRKVWKSSGRNLPLWLWIGYCICQNLEGGQSPPPPAPGSDGPGKGVRMQTSGNPQFTKRRLTQRSVQKNLRSAQKLAWPMAQGRRNIKKLGGDNPILWALSVPTLGPHIGIGLILIFIKNWWVQPVTNPISSVDPVPTKMALS